MKSIKTEKTVQDPSTQCFGGSRFVEPVQYTETPLAELVNVSNGIIKDDADDPLDKVHTGRRVIASPMSARVPVFFVGDRQHVILVAVVYRFMKRQIVAGTILYGVSSTRLLPRPACRNDTRMDVNYFIIAGTGLFRLKYAHFPTSLRFSTPSERSASSSDSNNTCCNQ